MKFKRGQEVTIRDDLVVGKDYMDDRFDERMKNMVGKTVTIRYVDNISGRFLIIQAKGVWNEKMIRDYTQLIIE